MVKIYFNHVLVSDSAVVQGQSGIEQNEGKTKPFQLTDLETKKDQLLPPDIGQKTNGRYRTRTCDPLIKSQLLCRLS